MFEKEREKMKKVIVFGTAGTVDREWQFIDVNKYEIIEFWDNNQSKWGKSCWNKEIVKPYAGANADLIWIASCFETEIRGQLLSLGYPKEIIKNRFYFVKEQLLKYYDTQKDIVDAEMLPILKRLQMRELNTWNTKWADDIEKSELDIYYDDSCGMYYVWNFGYEMYFAKKYDTKKKVS